MPAPGYRKVLRRWRRATLSAARSVLSISEPVKTRKKNKRPTIDAPASGAPINRQKRDPQELENAASYALGIARNTARMLQDRGIDLSGRSYLELGPGKDFGCTLIVGESCRRTIVADLYLAPWDEDYHPAFYTLLRSKLGRPARLLDRVIAQNGYAGVIETISEPAHALESLESGSIDVLFSNAVLEHVNPLSKATRELFRVTKRGGHGMHQVDFRDHRDFNRPLEQLLESKKAFRAEFARRFGEIGTQIRPLELERYFNKAGFTITRADANMMAEATYFDDLVARLRASQSAYRNWPRRDLKKLSVCYTVRKPRWPGAALWNRRKA